jgi:hypothetical protein
MANKGDKYEDEKTQSSASTQGRDDSPPPSEKGASASSSSASSSSTSASSSSTASAAESGGKPPYDEDAVEVQLKRAARQIRANCGSATDEEGKAAGPWGSATVSVVLGRNGHVKGVTVPPPYDGKPVGVCVVHAFEKIWFPPYAGSSDVSVDRDVQIVAPKRR